MKATKAQLGILLGLVLSTQLQAQSFLTNGLVAYYPFDGNVNDASGNGNNGTISGGAYFTTNRFGITNSAIYFPGSGEVTTSFFPPLGEASRTFEAWFNVPASGNDETMLTYGNPGAQARIELSIWNNGTFALDTSDGAAWTVPTYNDGNWHNFIVVLNSGTTLRNVLYYLDGNLVTDLTGDLNDVPNTVGTTPLMFGQAIPGVGGRQLTGALYDVRIYDRALSTNEVAELYAFESSLSLPVIVGEPAGETNLVGTTADFSVLATGYGLTYQWQLDSTNLPFATNSTLVLTNLTLSQAGVYDVVVSNSAGSVTSSPAIMDVRSVLIMVDGRVAGSVMSAIASATITITGGYPDGYLFYTLDGTTPTIHSSLYFGPFTLTNTAIVQVLNVNSNDTQSVLSPQVDVEIGTPPVITMSPSNVVLAAGTALNLTVSASGSGLLAYQWWDGSGAIADATNATYSVAAVELSDSGNYFAVVSNVYGSATSAVGTVTVYDPVVITVEPTNEVVPFKGTASFSVSATGYPAPTYQWLLNSTNLPGATSNILTISDVQLTNLGTYSVLVGNAYSSQTSAPALLTMLPDITTPFTGQTVIWGLGAVLSVGAIGSTPLNYQWYQNGIAIQGATNSVFSLASVQFTNAGLYTVVVSNAAGSVTNTPALLVVNPAGTSMGMYAGITLTGVAGYSYIIQYATDLQSTNSWVTLTNLTLEQPVELWVDTSTNALTTPHRFYQVLPGQ